MSLNKAVKVKSLLAAFVVADAAGSVALAPGRGRLLPAALRADLWGSKSRHFGPDMGSAKVGVLAILALVLAGCGAAHPACRADTCGGCCRNDVCELGIATDACGSAANACDVCVSGQLCQLGRCQMSSVGAGGGGGRVTDGGTATGGGGSAVGGGGGSSSGGGDGVTAPQINLAEKVWSAQADLWKSPSYFFETYGKSALSWLRTAATAAGSQVTTGTITLMADGTARYAPGGTTLRLSKPGFTGELRVAALVGDVTSSTFPGMGESIELSWLWAGGRSARCVLTGDEKRFSGTFTDVHGDEADVQASWVGSGSTSTYPGPSGNLVTSGFFSSTFSGTHTYGGGRVVRYTTQQALSFCVALGTDCSASPALDYRYQHDVSLRLDAATWTLKYVTGSRQQAQRGGETKSWSGAIAGPSTGTLIVRPVNSVFALDVVVGADRFTADSAAGITP